MWDDDRLPNGDSPASRSPRTGVLVVVPHEEEGVATSPEWTTILEDSHQIVLYNSDSHALSVRPTVGSDVRSRPQFVTGDCPFCGRPMDESAKFSAFQDASDSTRAPNYFQLLEIANERSSRAGTPGPSSGPCSSETEGPRHRSEEPSGQFDSRSMAEGYFHAFFKEEIRLGMGANGTVFLCQHILDGNPLGHFAVKKIAVGQSHTYLVQILQEIRLLEQLRHPNIITYHHAWLELHQFSSFGPKVPTLFVLMQWAEGGSLDDFVMGRMGRRQEAGKQHSNVDLNDDIRSRSDRIRAFRAERARPEEERIRRLAERRNKQRTAVHLLSAEEVHSLFLDVVSGLTFLHDKSILHLDLKPGNVLLTWDDKALTPRAMLSDFGTSRDMINSHTVRSGNTGTLEYAAPESLRSPQNGKLLEIDSKADMWSLGMILHMLLFFRLPYHYSSDGDMRSGGGDMRKLEKEVFEYQGFRRTHVMNKAFEQRGIPTSYLLLLESLLHRNPKARPTSEQVLRAILAGNFDPLPPRSNDDIGQGTLVPVVATGYFDEAPIVSSQLQTSDVEADTAANTPFEGSEIDLELETPREFEEIKVRHLLALPPSPGSEVPAQKPPRSLLARYIPAIERASLIRGVKSAVLIGKVMSMVWLCPAGRLDPLLTGTLTTLAVSDMWSSSLTYTGALAVAHIIGFHMFSNPTFCSI